MQKITVPTIGLFILIIFSCSEKKTDTAQSVTPVTEIIKTDAGFIAGAATDGLHIFKGIPFAAPPLKELRWKEPQPHAPWSDTLRCIAFGASPYQNEPKPFLMWSEEFIAPPSPLSEDCLFLNVWTNAKTTNDKLPVFVWIYGGGFSSGSSACQVYDGAAMASKGVVFVSINYRVGVFGFLAHPDLTTESGRNSSGNYGLMDQVAALKWVKQNIAAFGGDPDKVTIAGQSAGSMSVQALVASPLTKGLFSGAIAQSGAMTSRPTQTRAKAEETGLALAAKLNSQSIKPLREMTSQGLLDLANALPYGSFFPDVDGYVLPDDVKTIFEKGQANDVPLMAGWVSGDADLVLRNLQTADQFKTYLTKLGIKDPEALKLFPVDTEQHANDTQRKMAVLQFAAFPDRQWATSINSDAYLYSFTYVPTDKPDFPNYGAFHTAEVPFALHTLKLWDRPWTQTDLNVENFMSQYWLNFIKTGNPNGEGLPHWEKYEKSSGEIMAFDTSATPKPGLFSNEFEALETAKK